MRGRNLTKLLTAIELLSRSQGVTINQLSDELGIDRSSVYRMLSTMEGLGFPIHDDPGQVGREVVKRLERSYVKKLPNIHVPNIVLTLSEIMALYLLRGEAKIYRGTGIEGSVNSAFFKLHHFLPESFTENIGKLGTLFVGSGKLAKDYSGKTEVIDDLTEAIIRGEVCQVRYESFSAGAEKEYDIEPLHFFENRGGLYLFVRIPKYGDIRILAVERIKKLSPTKKTFEAPKDFDPEAKLAECFDIVCDDPLTARIWFSASQAKYVLERTYAKNQNVEHQKDGSIILTMKTSGRSDVKRWVMGFGPEAEVLEPVEMRREIEEELREALKRYKV